MYVWLCKVKTDLYKAYLCIKAWNFPAASSAGLDRIENSFTFGRVPPSSRAPVVDVVGANGLVTNSEPPRFDLVAYGTSTINFCPRFVSSQHLTTSVKIRYFNRKKEKKRVNGH